MAQQTTTDDEPATTDDLLNAVPSTGFTVPSNNEGINLYPDPTGHARGVLKHTFDGWPANGIVLYDVTGYEIVDCEFEPLDEDATMEEEFDIFEADIREYIDGVLFDSSLSSAEGNCGYVDHHTIEITNPYEGDSYTVALETENKRRVA